MRQVVRFPYLLFDAGGTVVFPDQDLITQQAWAHGIELTPAQLYEGYYHLVYAFDCRARGRTPLPPQWPQGYVRALFDTLGIASPAVQDIVKAVDEQHNLQNIYTFTFPWVRETLSYLASQRYSMSVISNSDGRTDELLCKLGLTLYFDHIFDSKVLGLAKPDPRIFKKALSDLGLQPADALFVGDVFEVDVRGANLAGIGGIHLDPLRLYQDWPGVHLTDVRELPDWLTHYMAVPSAFDLFPFKEPVRR